MKGYLHSIESFSALDGPGIRSVVFLQGCPLRCLYCHNPESWILEEGILTDSQEIIARISKNLRYIQKGGVTVSGGEPTFQIDFLLELLKGFKAMGLHTTVDTSGYVDIDKINKIADFTDLFIVDIKHMNPRVCMSITGKSNYKAFALLDYLAHINKDVWIRSVLLPELTDHDNYIKEICTYVKTLKNVKRFELLPCHNLAENKYKELRLKNHIKFMSVYDNTRLQMIESQYHKYFGEKVII